ncbi:MAG: DUF6798 domain-containing protein [Acidobacteriota bacterium]
MSSRLHKAVSALAPLASIVIVATSIIAFNGGIAVGSSNHVGLLPVVRRLINPEYLPGDFNIELRLFHHRVFAWVLAQLSIVLGEDRAVIALHLFSVLALSAGLYYLTRTLNLSTWAYLLIGLLLSVGAFWIGLGLEENNFVGNQEVQPTTLAHAFVLAGTAALLQKRWRLCAFFAGLTVLLHLQIGFIFVLLIAPFFAMRLREFGWRGTAMLAIVFLIPAAPAIWNAQRLLQRGVSNASFSVDYLRFRMPHHFELASTAAGLWFLAHLTVLLWAAWWLRRRDHGEATKVGAITGMSLLLTGLILLHAIDYNWLHFNTTLKFQFPRLSPLVTVFGGLVMVKSIGLLPSQWPRRAGYSALILAGVVHAGSIVRQPERFSLAVRKYYEQKSDWVEMCLWIKANGESTVYLAPPGRYGFTYLTDRSSVVEFKINPDGGQFLREWTERLTDLAGGSLPIGRGLENRRLIDRAYARLSIDSLRALGGKYNAHYAVLPQTSRVELPVVHENGEYRLVSLSAMYPSSQ